MAVPISFPSTTSRFSLPLLFAGQAQKEFFVNQAFSLIDSLMTGTVKESLDTPPIAPIEGESFRIVAPASGDWAGHDDELAIFVGGAWHFVAPQSGMRVFDQQADAFVHFSSGWQVPVEPTQPSGGSTIDAEARQIIAELIEALQKSGVFARTA
ncbi:DUF2793 domain-containing protein [uncultured Erythrobacter sp.]|uniref:DUF2793 domain-containing protein n=1 Tax=uncultured Erythrobacter sp. TaxID=263913 RepID=UPI00263536F3|nr:DUF2793 domain-containing protein [uncultured Erythrobacter sp.]